MKILVVEDSSAQASILEHVLKGAGHQVITARDGLEGIEKAYREKPHCIVSDIVMPRMNGWQLIRFLKSDKEMRHVPVILMTTKEESTARLFSRMSGADGYLTKQPFSPEKLLEVIDEVVPSEMEGEREQGIQVDRDMIISRINELLDSELLRSSLFNEIARISRDIQNLPRTCLSILKVIQQVLGFDLGAILIAEEGMFLYIAREISEKCIKQFEGKMVQCAKTLLGVKLTVAELKVERFGKRTNAEVSGLKAFTAFALKELGAVVGAGSASWDRFHPKDLEVARATEGGLQMIIQNALMHRKVQAMAITDGLTSLFTHRHLQESLDREIHRAKRFQKSFSVLLLDIDDFKKLNDSYGHLFGDHVLRELAGILRQQVRETDVVGRYGGEEFMVILSETSREGAHITAERIRRAVELHPFEQHGRKVSVTVSGGLATYPEDASYKKKLIETADKCLYRAKTLGKNRVEVPSCDEVDRKAK